MKSKIKLLFDSIVFSIRLITDTNCFLICLYGVLCIIGTTIPIITAYLMRYLLNSLEAGRKTLNYIIFIIFLYVIVSLVLQVVNVCKGLCYSVIFKKADHKYNCCVLKKIASLPLEFVDSTEGKNIIDEIKNAKQTVVRIFDRVIQIIAIIYSFMVAFISLYHFNILFVLIFLVLTVPSIIANEMYHSKKHEFVKKTAPDMRKCSYYRWMLTDAWPAKDVRAYNISSEIKYRYDEEKSKYKDSKIRIEKKHLQYSILVELISKLGEIIFTIYIIYQAIMGGLGVGDITLYIGFAVTLSSSFRSIVSLYFSEYKRTTDYMKTIIYFFSLGENIDKKVYRTLDKFESIEFRNVFFKYPGTEAYVLSGISFIINKGDKISIIGLNGSGKTTIIKLILGLYKVSSGEILINGYPYDNYDIIEVRKLFSVLFQTFVQYPLTLRENITLSNIDNVQNDYAIIQALNCCNLNNDIYHNLKNNLDVYMTRQFDDKGIELSRGQWQKIALARAYFKNAPVIILDEPSAALDAESEDLVFENFSKIANNQTGIMISHRISSAKLSAQIFVIEDGKIIEQGSHSDLLKLNGSYTKLYNLQKEKYTGLGAKANE